MTTYVRNHESKINTTPRNYDDVVIRRSVVVSCRYIRNNQHTLAYLFNYNPKRTRCYDAHRWRPHQLDEVNAVSSRVEHDDETGVVQVQVLGALTTTICLNEQEL